jgi:single-stranded-DNA-specific exonuclease
VAIDTPDSATPGRAFRLEPYSYAEARALMEALGLAEPVAVTLVRRGYRTIDEARAFLEAAETHDPFEFDSMAGVVERVKDAVAHGRKITVHGDYDCDGVCSTSILVGALRDLGAECDWYIPDRLGEGYGLTIEGLERLAASGTGLLLTADCGIGSAAEVAAGRAAGMEVIVTDHHEPSERLPDCPILHPRLSSYPCGDLCATGVAYKLSAALVGEERARDDLDLVALATVADVVPLRGENRALVRAGLAVARAARRPGLRALCAAAGVLPERLDEGDLAFRLGPRINAAGRLYRADAGVELMLTQDAERAAAIATELDRVNHERRDAELLVLGAAESERAGLSAELAAAPALVLAGEGWHPGVVGIVASRLAERHWVPVVLIGLNAEGRGRGSGRSIAGFDLLAALDACGEHLVRYGGHRAAAGLEIEAGSLDAFRDAFAAHATAKLGERELVRTEAIDAVVGGESLGHDVAEQFERLAPFGSGNPGVRLLVPSARVRDVRPMGEGDRHARFRLESGSRSALGVAFRVNGELAAAERADPLDVSVKLELNEWNGAVEPRVVLGELYPALPGAAGGESPYPADEEWWRRVDAEREARLADWPPRPLIQTAHPRERRVVVDRRGGSGVAAVAALASSGEALLAVCADALRRRELIERAAAPARFGGGSVALLAGAFADAAIEEGVRQLKAAGAGVALADWAMLARHPSLPDEFEHLVIIDPPPFPHLQAVASGSTRQAGFLHLAWGEAEIELALRVHHLDWPLRPSLAALYRTLRDAGDEDAPDGGLALGGARLREALEGGGHLRRSAEVAGRCLRVLEELGAVRWQGSGPERGLGVVSSEGKDLDQLDAFVAYRARYEEGRQFLSQRRQPN